MRHRSFRFGVNLGGLGIALAFALLPSGARADECGFLCGMSKYLETDHMVAQPAEPATEAAAKTHPTSRRAAKAKAPAVAAIAAPAKPLVAPKAPAVASLEAPAKSAAKDAPKDTPAASIAPERAPDARPARRAFAAHRQVLQRVATAKREAAEAPPIVLPSAPAPSALIPGSAPSLGASFRPESGK